MQTIFATTFRSFRHKKLNVEVKIDGLSIPILVLLVKGPHKTIYMII